VSNYFGIDAVNWSTLKLLDESPLAYRHAVEHGRPDSAALALGRVTHTLVFEPHKFTAEYAVYEGGDRRGKAWEAFQAAHEDKTILKPGEIATAQAMADAVRSHPLVRPYLAGGQFERVLQWRDRATGIDCKAKADWIVPGLGLLCDLKTARSVDARRFALDVARYGYHGQLAHYANGVEADLGWKVRRHMIIAVEKAAPHDVAVFDLAPEAVECGREKVAELLAKLAACRESNQWPGRYTTEQALDLPGWVYGAGEAEISFDEEDE